MSVTERKYPKAIYLVNHKTRTESLVSGGTRSAVAKIAGSYHNFWGDEKVAYSAYQSLRFDFGLKNSQYAKTMQLRALPTKIHVYATAKSGQSSALVDGGLYDPYFCLLQTEDKYWLPTELGGHTGDQWRAIKPSQWVDLEIKSRSQYQVALIPSVNGGNFPANRDTTFDASVTVDTYSNKPYVDLTWDPVKPKAWARFPTAGAFVDDTQPAVFGWDYDGSKSYDDTYNRQTGATFFWRTRGSEQNHTIEVTGEVFEVTIPAGTLPASAELEWGIVAHSTFGGDAPTVWTSFVTTDTLPQAPAELDPNNARVDNNGPVILRWVHVNASGTAQTAAEVETSKNHGSTWQPLRKVTGPAQQVEIPAHGLPAGNVLWRVRTKSSDGVLSPWTTAQIIVQAAPLPPSIRSATESPRPVISWQHAEQQGWQVLIRDGNTLLYDSGIHYGNAKTIKCPVYLPAGQVTATVRICTVLGKWAEAQTMVNVSNVDTNSNPGPITAHVQQRAGVVTVSWAGAGYPWYYVLRDGRPIARIEGTRYEDLTAAGQHQYQVMGIYGTDADYYTLSAPQTLTVSVFSGMLVDMDAAERRPVWLRLHRSAPPVMRRSTSRYVEYHAMAGRQLPAAFAAESGTVGLTLEYTVRHADHAALTAMVGHTVCVKLRDGTAGMYMLESTAENIWKHDDVTLQLTQVDYSEEVPYV